MLLDIRSNCLLRAINGSAGCQLLVAFFLATIGTEFQIEYVLFAADQPALSRLKEPATGILEGEKVAKSQKITDPGDLEAFFDGAMQGELLTNSTAGVVVAVVSTEKLLFSKGYGFADVDSLRTIDPEKTLFRIGSISSLFTWTAVMQLVEEGKLDLNADANSYLRKFKIPSSFGEPVSLKHLMAHTSGFDDTVVGFYSNDSASILPLGQILQDKMPSRVRIPGVLPAYSNYGVALAGDIVASAAGLTWEDYIEQRILHPLGMDRTHVRQPAIEQLPGDHSKGYQWESGRFIAKPFEYVPMGPAGGISMTAVDAAKWMRVLLNNGELDNSRILKVETSLQMREPLFRPDPKADAVCHGLIEMTRNGQRLLGHEGHTRYFNSLMQILPEHGIGVFLAFNTNTGKSATQKVLSSFLNRYYPVPPAEKQKSIAGFSERSKAVTGEYLSTRQSRNSIAKIGAIAGVYYVSVNDDETISIRSIGKTRRYVEVEPFVYQDLNGSERVIFQEGVNKQIDVMCIAGEPTFAAKRSEWHESTLLHSGVLVVATLIFLTAIFYWPIIAFSADGIQAYSIGRSGLRGALTSLAWLQSLLCVGFLVAMAIELRDPTELMFGITANLKILLLVPQVCVVLSILSFVACMIAWIHGFWYIPERLHFTLVVIAGVAFVWLLHFWNLLKFGS